MLQTVFLQHLRPAMSVQKAHCFFKLYCISTKIAYNLRHDISKTKHAHDKL